MTFQRFNLKLSGGNIQYMLFAFFRDYFEGFYYANILYSKLTNLNSAQILLDCQHYKYKLIHPLYLRIESHFIILNRVKRHTKITNLVELTTLLLTQKCYKKYLLNNPAVALIPEKVTLTETSKPTKYPTVKSPTFVPLDYITHFREKN